MEIRIPPKFKCWTNSRVDVTWAATTFLLSDCNASLGGVRAWVFMEILTPPSRAVELEGALPEYQASGFNHYSARLISRHCLICSRNSLLNDWVESIGLHQLYLWWLQVLKERPHDCLLNHLFRHRSKKTSKLRVTGLCAGNSPGTGEFPAQRDSYAENVSIWWRHHVIKQTMVAK